MTRDPLLLLDGSAHVVDDMHHPGSSETPWNSVTSGRLRFGDKGGLGERIHYQGSWWTLSSRGLRG